MSHIIETLTQQLTVVEELLQKVMAIPNGHQGFVCVVYDQNLVRNITNEAEEWVRETKEYLILLFGEESRQVADFDRCIRNKNHYTDFREDLKEDLDKCITFLKAQIKAEAKKQEFSVLQPIEKNHKPRKVFISHKKEDEAYADALVNLINFVLGADGDKVFCSSVPGYGISLSGDILDELKAQFDNYDIFMVIIHSPRYYRSAICLNEMGAAWALGTKFCSFMTKDCKYEHMHGVIGREKICVNLNDGEKTLNAHLNNFKDDLVDFFGAGKVDQNKWENARGRFTDEVSALTYDPLKESDVDLFELLYLPAFDHIFEMLDIENFQRWAYPCAIGGYTSISTDVYDMLCQVPNYIISRPRHKEYASWDALMRNLGLLVDDFTTVFSEHIEKMGDDRYIVERFYKRHINNPNYEEDLAAYNEHVWLVSDMLFELARLGNLILSRIREKYPDYKKELGILHIDNRLSEPDLVYRDSEVSDAPYPGLKDYIKVRLTREKHLGNNPNIDESGYERKQKCSR